MSVFDLDIPYIYQWFKACFWSAVQLSDTFIRLGCGEI